MRKRFDIEGMHCASCAYRLQKHLRKLDGIREANVNLASESILLDYDPEKITLRTLTSEVQEMGYKLIPDNDNRGQRFNYERKIRRKNIKRKRRRNQLTVAVIFLIPLLAIGLSPLLKYNLPFSIDPVYSPVNFAVMQLFLCVPILLAGWRFFEKGWKRLFRLQPNIDSLVALGATAAFIYSVVSTVLIIYRDGTISDHPLYYLTSGAIITMIMLGRFLENGLRRKHQNTLYRLISLIPDLSTKIIDGTETSVNTLDIVVGDKIRVTPGTRIPVDGKVLSGLGMIDESIFTGSKTPVLKSAGDKVIAGMFNQEGYFTVEATHTGNDTFLSGIIRLIEEGETSQPPVGRLADKVSAWVIPAVLILSLLSAVMWYLFLGDYAFAMNIFVSVLVIACPVAIGLAIPISVVFASRKASSMGIIVRRSEAFEQIHKADTFVFNLTGTITEGNAAVTDFITFPPFSEDRLLSLAASAESESKHPLAKAIVARAKEKGVPILIPDPVKLIAGQGIEAVILEERVDIGNYKLMELINIDPDVLTETSTIIRELSNQGKTAVMIAVEGVLQGVIAIEDKPRPEAREVIQKLKQMEISNYILTGEHAPAAKNIGEKVDINHIIADVLPQNRSRQIRKLQHEGKTVLMIGDGMNDASALAQANAGIAIGSPDNIAADAADIVLLNKDLRQILVVVRLSRKTMRNIKENLFFAFVYNLLMLPVAAGVLYLFGLKFLLDPLIAVVAMFLGSISVVINALRLRKFK
ncbi:MAG: heavy metal translocating P-type ATPase [Bacteroidales bacterium]